MARLAALRLDRNRTEDITLVEAEHREHAVVEQVIADLKNQALAHFPPRHFNANAAWTVLVALAHNLLRWTQLLGLPDTTVRAASTLRRRLLAIPGRLTPTHEAGRFTARPAGLARRLHQRAQPHSRAPRRRLTAARLSPTTSRPAARRARSRADGRTRSDPSADAPHAHHPRRPPPRPRHRGRRAQFTTPSHPDRWIRAKRTIAQPFEWTFTHAHLDALLARLASREPHLRLAA